jgi:uncharacterized protein YgfB (UPF0149 family)
MHPSVAFDDVARTLSFGASAVHPAEAHGCLCGALCVRREYSLAEWIDEILPDGGVALTGDGPLEGLFEESAGVLTRAEMEFEPLLPDDETDLAARVEALGAWCQGFLYGFGAAGTAAHAKLPATVNEVLADLAQLSHVGVPDGEAPEAEESAYAELVEFLRAAVQLVYDELAGLRQGQPVSQSGH